MSSSLEMKSFEDSFSQENGASKSEDLSTTDDGAMERMSYCGLFRYAKKMEILMFIVGIICSAGLGALFPLSMALFADMVDAMILTLFMNAPEMIEGQIPLFVYLAVSSLVLGFFQMYFLTLSSKRQARRIRLLFFYSLLRQDAGWMDSQASGSLISLLSSSVPRIQGGIGNRVGSFVRDTVLFTGCIIMAYIKGWQLALVASASLPLIAISFALLGFSLKFYNNKEIRAYSKAGGIAGEVLSSIRTVFAFGGQEHTHERYSKELYKAERTGIKKGMAIGAGNGFVSLSIFSAAALCLWYGTTLVRTERFSNGTVILVVVSIIISSIAIGKALPEVEAIASAVTAAKKVYAVIDRVPPIDIDRDGEIPTDMKGHIEFRGVCFNYPTRPDVPILQNFNLKITPGQKVAIVGFSGSGKSTAVHLIQRLYDPNEGQVLLDGQDIRDLDVTWLRSQLGTVSQEAALFTGSIADNIRMGRMDATDQEVVEAATLASAHAFIMKFPDGYNTILTEGGAKLSGGQRQRIAIARALLRHPKILLLDEATSALDTGSEKAVQQALNNACVGRSVIMVAHRLTTIREADKIIVMRDGMILEEGTHDELRDQQGQYYRMLQAQGLLKEETTVNEPQRSMVDLEKLGVKMFESKVDDYESVEKDDDEIYAEPEDKAETKTLLLKHKSPMLQALKLNKPEYPYLFLGLIMAIAVGIIEPLFALVYSDMFDLALMIFTPGKMQRKADQLAISMILLGIMRMIATFIQRFMLGIAGEGLTKRVRGMLFKSILKQDVAWFDRDENQPGVLTARLAADAPSLEKISGTQLGVMVEATCLVLVSLSIACSFSWQLTLVNLAFFPFLVLASIVQLKDMGSSERQRHLAGVNIAQEALTSHRTVISFGLEKYYSGLFSERVGRSAQFLDWSNVFFSTVSTVAQSMQYFQMAASFSVGAILLREKAIGTFTVFRVFTLISFSAQGVGRAASFLPDLKSANTGANKIMELLERPTQMEADEGETPTKAFSGDVEFKDVKFAYPDRKGVIVLNGFDHKIEAGTSVALVGQSGCGKSTILQLIQRFYDVECTADSGGIFMSGKNTRFLAPNWIRQHIGCVFQNSDLFDLSIRENIAFGDCSKNMPMKEIIEAAKIANIHQFIESLPQGYDTMVGIGGSQLSGGQRQRIAIARALVRRPALLLLDEATSALDAENERDVQAALSETISRASMTCIVVAHRLSTVSACDCVVVVDNGQKIECGPPAALLEARGAFYALHTASG